MKLLTCKKCRWVHEVIGRDHAVAQILKMKEYYDTLSPEEQLLHYGNRPATISMFMTCFMCGNSYKDFRPSTKGDAPDGLTIGSILDKDEK